MHVVFMSIQMCYPSIPSNGIWGVTLHFRHMHACYMHVLFYVTRMSCDVHVTCMKNVRNPCMLHETCMYINITTCMLGSSCRAHDICMLHAPNFVKASNCCDCSVEMVGFWWMVWEAITSLSCWIVAYQGPIAQFHARPKECCGV